MLYFLLLFSSVGAPWVKKAHRHRQPDDWWFGMGDSWQTSNHLARNNPYYNTYRQSAAQMDWWGYAQHVGKINTGKFVNPGLNMPRHRALGHQADFNPEDLKSGAFRSKPQGQRVQATGVYVNLGLATDVGEVVTLPPGQHVQADGSVLVEASPRQRSPCHPDPCKHLALYKCNIVNQVTAKCSDSGKEVKLVLTGYDLSDNGIPNVNYLALRPEFHNGVLCTETDCGVVSPDNDLEDATDYIVDDEPSEQITTLGQGEDGSNYRDYTYGLLVIVGPNNPSVSRTKLRVMVDGRERQVLAVPQWDGTTNVNYDGRPFYFFGCFRPQTGLVDTRGAGFYGTDSDFLAALQGGADICRVQLDWIGGPGFNPYDGSGTGTPNDSDYFDY